jgi:hypothetical protein
VIGSLSSLPLFPYQLWDLGDRSENARMKIVHPVPVHELAPLKRLTSKIQDEKRAAIVGTTSRWAELTKEFAQLEEVSARIPYAGLDLEYLRDSGDRNRSFGYVITYDTFICPARDVFGRPIGKPEFLSVLKLGDGGREDGRSAGKASGSIISRTVRSYWDDENIYSAVLQGVVVPGNDTSISRKIGTALGGSELRVRGDVWRIELLDHLSVDELLSLMEVSR